MLSVHSSSKVKWQPTNLPATQYVEVCPRGAFLYPGISCIPSPQKPVGECPTTMPAYRVVERCSICGKPITEGQAKESDGGKPVHQECLIDLSKGASNSLR